MSTTLRDLCNWFDEEGLAMDDPITFAISPTTTVLVASVYMGSKGQPCVDLIESEDEDDC